MMANQGATPPNAVRPPPRPARGHGSVAVPMFQPNDAPRRPRRNSNASTTTVVNDTTHVISAAVLLRWKPLTQQHHAQSAAAPTTYGMRSVCMEPV